MGHGGLEGAVCRPCAPHVCRIGTIGDIRRHHSEKRATIALAAFNQRSGNAGGVIRTVKLDG
jgi:hypothetical protein